MADEGNAAPPEESIENPSPNEGPIDEEDMPEGEQKDIEHDEDNDDSDEKDDEDFLDYKSLGEEDTTAAQVIEEKPKVHRIEKEKSSSFYLSSESSGLFCNKSLISLNEPKSWPSNDGCSFFRVSSDSLHSNVTKSISIKSSETPSEPESITLTISKVDSSISTSLFSTSSVSEVKPEVKEVKSTESSELTEGFPYLMSIFPLPVKEDVLAEITFRESLLVSYDIEDMEDNEIIKLLPSNSQEVGGYCLSVECTNATIITFVSSQFSLNGSGAKSTILSTSDTSFNLIDEIKTETQCFRSCKIEKSLHVVRENDGYVAFRKDLIGHNERKYRANINLKKSGDFVLDGGAFALMRYLVIANFKGIFAIWTMDINGQLGKYVFECGKIYTIRIHHRPYMTILIKKTLFRHNKMPDFSHTYFLPSGHIVRHRWSGCQYFLHINPLLNFETMQLGVEHKWSNDIILVSKYIEEKARVKYDIQEYFHENPEIKDLLKDYLLCLLQIKPNNILNFSIEFFLNLYTE